jgi:6,7-dimethyl-8-ribityllumazine synthase
MIKGITFTRHIHEAADYERLASFFAELGVEPRNSLGDSGVLKRQFVAPRGILKFVHAERNARNNISPQVSDNGSDVYIEVTSLDSIRQVTKAWLEANPSGATDAVSEIVDTQSDSRLFTATPVPGHSVTFWEWSNPLKGKPLALEGDLSAEGMRFAVVVARWNAVITDRLLLGSLDALFRSGARKADVGVTRVPGAWEIPSAARKLAETGNFDAIITLGLLLRGETAHYEAIYNEVSRGIGQSQQETGIPHAFGVLTCETLDQALDRAGLKGGNKGFEAAVAAIEMVSLHRTIGMQGQRVAVQAETLTEPSAMHVGFTSEQE